MQNVIEVAKRHGISLVQLLLAFVLQQPDVAAIPKAVSFNHIDENLAALEVQLSEADMEQLADSFPSPDHKILMEKY